MGNYNLKYPIGEFVKPDIISNEILYQLITTIENFPKVLAAEIENLSAKGIGI